MDDDSDAREVLALHLTQQGATISASSSAPGALDKIATFKPDVIVADIGMPGEDGYSLIRKVRSSYTKFVPAIALTAYAGDANRRHALEAGYQKHISKPADPEEIITTIAGLGFHAKDTENSE